MHCGNLMHLIGRVGRIHYIDSTIVPRILRLRICIMLAQCCNCLYMNMDTLISKHPHKFARSHTFMQRTHTQPHLHSNARTYAHTCKHSLIHIRAQLHSHAHTCAYALTHVCTCTIYAYKQTPAQICLHSHLHEHSYSNAHRCTHSHICNYLPRCAQSHRFTHLYRCTQSYSHVLALAHTYTCTMEHLQAHSHACTNA